MEAATDNIFNAIKQGLESKWGKMLTFETDPAIQIHLREDKETEELSYNITLNRLTEEVFTTFFSDLDVLFKNQNINDVEYIGLFIECRKITDQGAKEIANLFAKVTTLESVVLNLKTQVSDQGLREIATSIKENLKDLVNIALYIEKNIQVTDEGLTALGISASQNLQGLSLNVIDCNQITDKGIEGFMKNVNDNVPALIHLSVYLRELDNITDGFATNFFSQISNLKSLLRLSLSVVRCVQITNQGASALAPKTHEQFKNLKTLSISTRGCTKVSDQGLRDMTRHISAYHQGIQELTLDFTDCHEVTDQGLKDISVNIANLVDLKKLAIWLTRCTQISDQGLKELAVQIGDFLKSLQDFQLDIAGHITDDGLKDLTLLVSNNLLDLQRFHVEITGKITNQGVKTFATHIANNVRKLEYLHVNFSGCTDVTTETLRSAQVMLKEIKNLNIL